MYLYSGSGISMLYGSVPPPERTSFGPYSMVAPHRQSTVDRILLITFAMISRDSQHAFYHEQGSHRQPHTRRRMPPPEDNKPAKASRQEHDSRSSRSSFPEQEEVCMRWWGVSCS